MRALEALADVTPPGMSLFTFFSAGTEAVEGAMRVARAITGRHGFVSFHNDYHGRTGGAASVTSSRSSNAPRDAGSYLLPGGHAYRCAFCQGSCDLRCAEFVGQSVGQNLPGELAGAVMELVTNGNGATTYRPGYVAAVAEQVRAAGGVFIADEIATGFGRTGALVRQRAGGRRPRRDGARQGHGQRVPGDRHRRARRARRGAGGLVPEHELRRQPDGVRGDRRRDRGDAPGGPRHPLRRARRVRAGADAGDGRAAPDHRRGAGPGALLAIELVKDRATKEPFVEAGNLVYQTAFRRGLAWATAGHILRITPPIVMSNELMAKGLDIIDEAIGDAERHFGY